MRLRRDLIGKIYFLLPMDRIESALAEVNILVEALGLEIIHIEPGVILVDYTDHVYREDIFRRLLDTDFSMIKELGISLWVFEDIETGDELKSILIKLRDHVCLSGELRIRVIKDKYIKINPYEITNLLDKCSIENTDTSIIIGDIAIVGRAIYRRSLIQQDSLRLDETATMKLIDSRFMSDLLFEKVKDTSVIYDPFSGVGYLISESCRRGYRVILSDIDLKKIHKAKNILTENKCIDYDLFQADAFNLPIRSGAVDGVISDIPYGRRSKIVSKSVTKDLYSLIRGLIEILKPYGIIILAMSYDQWKYLSEKIQANIIRNLSLQHLHSNLHRVYVMLRKHSREPH